MEKQMGMIILVALSLCSGLEELTADSPLESDVLLSLRAAISNPKPTKPTAVAPAPISMGALKQWLRGPPGGRGPPGPHGIAGPRGPLGKTGKVGVSGPMGRRGRQGPQGPAGPRGERGSPGKNAAGGPGRLGRPGPPGKSVVGPRGDRGPRGPRGKPGKGKPGPPGKVANTGMRGRPGPPGQLGKPGLNGKIGPEGARGPRGLRGRRGHKGDRGLPGQRGPPGSKGRGGKRGPRGLPGTNGTNGKPGGVGRVGESGLRGASGRIGPAGPRGKPGKAGKVGQRGPQGEKNCETGVSNEKKVQCSGTGVNKKCTTFRVPVRLVTCGSQATPVKWGINTLPTSALSINGEIEASGNVKAKTMMVERQTTMLGEGQDMEPEQFAKLVSGNSVDLGKIAIEMHKQVHFHKHKIARLEKLVEKQTAILTSMASRLSLMEEKE